MITLPTTSTALTLIDLHMGRHRMQKSAEDTQLKVETDDGEVAVEQERNADEWINMLKDVLESVCAKLMVEIEESDRTNGDLQNLAEVRVCFENHGWAFRRMRFPPLATRIMA
jgi:hypothetical protein